MMLRKTKGLVIFLSIFIVLAGVSLAWVWVRAASTPLSTIGWQQVNESGFGSLQNIGTLDTYKDQMYAGTWAPSGYAAEMWRTADGRTWEKFSPLFTSQGVIFDSIPFSNSLFIGTGSDSWNGAEIWRTNGVDWELVASEGFGDVNWGMNAFAVFSDTIVAATSNITTGIEVWGSPTGDFGSWEQLNSDGFGLGIVGQDSLMETYNDYLYFCAGLNGLATLLRTDDLITWTPVFTDGLGNPNNTNVTALAEFKGDFYIGLRNITDGGEVWRTSNGVDFSPVITGGLGDVNNMRPYGLIVYEDYLYLVLNNPVDGAGIWRTSDGDSWIQVGFGGWGDSSNYFGDYNDKGATIYNNSLFFGTFNNVTGGQIWQMLFSPDTVTISGPTTGDLETGYEYIGTLTPITATVPITYLWEATDYAPFTMTSGITSTIIYNWAIPGLKQINVTASNAAGSTSNTYHVYILAPYQVFLPLSLK
jgi:hypothetical protein